MNNEESIKQYLIDNREHLMLLIEPFKKQRELLLANSNSLFKQDIESQYKHVVKWTIIRDIECALKLPMDDIVITIESMNLNHYLDQETIDVEV